MVILIPILILTTGFPISTEVEVSGKTYYADLYASFWGLWASPLYDQDTGSYIDSNQVLDAIESGHKVEKVDYATNTKSEYTLKKTNARLSEISRKTVTLDDIKMLPIHISSYGNIYDGYTIMWTGEKLVIAGKDKTMCIKINEDKPWDYSNVVDTDFEVTDDWQCGCLDDTNTVLTLRSTGDWKGEVYDTYNGEGGDETNGAGGDETNGADGDETNGLGRYLVDENFYFKPLKAKSVEYDVTKLPDFTPAASAFPHGLNFNMNGFWATLELEYEQVQVLHGLDFDTYTVDQVVEQDLGGGKIASGTINMNTPVSLKGVECPGITINGWIESIAIEHEVWYGTWTENVQVLHVESTVPSGSELGPGLQIQITEEMTYPWWRSRRLNPDTNEGTDAGDSDGADNEEGDDDDYVPEEEDEDNDSNNDWMSFDDGYGEEAVAFKGFEYDDTADEPTDDPDAADNEDSSYTYTWTQTVYSGQLGELLDGN